VVVLLAGSCLVMGVGGASVPLLTSLYGTPCASRPPAGIAEHNLALWSEKSQGLHASMVQAQGMGDGAGLLLVASVHELTIICQRRIKPILFSK
jgi:hypothetical protein